MQRFSPWLGVLLGASSSAALADASQPGSLFARLGGESGIAAIVNDSVTDRLARDPGALKQQLAARICSLAGGGCDLPRSPIELEASQYLALLEGLRSSMRAHQVPLPARNELLEALAPVRREMAR